MKSKLWISKKRGDEKWRERWTGCGVRENIWKICLRRSERTEDKKQENYRKVDLCTARKVQ
jgi:hypothetical protein